VSPRDDALGLSDIADALTAIERHLKRGAIEDELVFDACRARLIEIGEAVKDLDPELLAFEPGVRWREIAASRGGHRRKAMSPSGPESEPRRGGDQNRNATARGCRNIEGTAGACGRSCSARTVRLAGRCRECLSDPRSGLFGGTICGSGGAAYGAKGCGELTEGSLTEGSPEKRFELLVEDDSCARHELLTRGREFED
jgi:hypothetical protein